MASFSNIMCRVFNSKHWRNSSEYCDHKRHPYSVNSYRRYRRGTNRCATCGAKIGKPTMIRKSHRDDIVDNIYTEIPFFKRLAQMSK